MILTKNDLILRMQNFEIACENAGLSELFDILPDVWGLEYSEVFEKFCEMFEGFEYLLEKFKRTGDLKTASAVMVDAEKLTFEFNEFYDCWREGMPF